MAPPPEQNVQKMGQKPRDIPFSQRTQDLKQHAHPYHAIFGQVVSPNLFDAVRNPDGVIELGVAQNKLEEAVLKKQFNQVVAEMGLGSKPSKEQEKDLQKLGKDGENSENSENSDAGKPEPNFISEQSHLWYGNDAGTPRLKETFAKILGECVFKTPGSAGISTSSSDKPKDIEIKPENVLVSNGCGSLLEILGTVLCDPSQSSTSKEGESKEGESKEGESKENLEGKSKPDDCILYFSPRYNGFSWYFRGLNCVQTLEFQRGTTEEDFHLFQNGLFPSAETLDAFLQKAERERNIRPRALVLCSPDNPSGVIWQKSALMELSRWCRANEITLVSDEIYAYSCFPADSSPNSEQKTEFFSLYEHADVVLWGLSKDFGACGLRCGVLYTRNQELMAKCEKYAENHQLPAFAQEVLDRLLRSEIEIDVAFVKSSEETQEEVAAVKEEEEVVKSNGESVSPSVKEGEMLEESEDGVFCPSTPPPTCASGDFSPSAAGDFSDASSLSASSAEPSASGNSSPCASTVESTTASTVSLHQPKKEVCLYSAEQKNVAQKSQKKKVPFAPYYLNLVRHSLKKSHDLVRKYLGAKTGYNLEFIETCDSGMFFWLNFAEFRGVTVTNKQGQAKIIRNSQDIFQLLLSEANVFLTPGDAFYDAPADDCCWMRICYATCSYETLELGLLRLEKLVGKLRRAQASQGAVVGGN